MRTLIGFKAIHVTLRFDKRTNKKANTLSETK